MILENEKEAVRSDLEESSAVLEASSQTGTHLHRIVLVLVLEISLAQPD
jgi:hypothetical protein